MTAPFCDDTSPFKGLSMKDYENPGVGSFQCDGWLGPSDLSMLELLEQECREYSVCSSPTDSVPDTRSHLSDFQSDGWRGPSDFQMLELLDQECREKEALINELKKQLAEWEDLHEARHCAPLEKDRRTICSSSTDSVPDTRSHLVPGHRPWADHSALTEDYSALRRQISEGRKLARSMGAQLQECVRALKQQGADNKGTELRRLKSLSRSMNTMQQVFKEAHRLVKLVRRVSLPAAVPAGERERNQQSDFPSDGWRGPSDFQMLELLDQECREKEALINELKKQLKRRPSRRFQ